MATFIHDNLSAGLGTLTLELYPKGSSTLASSATAAEDGTRSGYHQWTVADNLAGSTYDAIIKRASGTKIGGGEVYIKASGANHPITPAFQPERVSRQLSAENVSVTVVSAIVGSVITFLRGDTVTVEITGLGDISGRTKLWFTAKQNTAAVEDPEDSAALVQITEGDGLVVLNGESSGLTATDGSITVDDAVAGDITITLKSAATKQLPITSHGGVYDVQMLAGTTVTTLTSGTTKVTQDVTKEVA